jgi:type I restriction enzyme M protein
MDTHITKLTKNGKLFHVIQEFNTAKGYMGADTITSTDMGYVFEDDLVKRFSESYNEEAGAHFTSRDIIYLMTDILLSEEKEILMEEGVVKTVYDQTMHTLFKWQGCLIRNYTKNMYLLLT